MTTITEAEQFAQMLRSHGAPEEVDFLHLGLYITASERKITLREAAEARSAVIVALKNLDLGYDAGERVGDWKDIATEEVQHNGKTQERP
jgi:hypothetical protein